MRNKKLLIAALATGLIVPLCSCSGNQGSKVITLWVGEESAKFYQAECQEFLKENKDFGYSVKVVGVDSGSTGGAMSDDNTKCGDIITVAHDNIGKLIDKNRVLPFTEESLVDQVNADNPKAFKDVIFYENDIGEGKKTYLYGVPYVSQALFLYYNKAKVTAQQATTFEGLMAAAKSAGASVKAFTITGTDGFNYSFNLLARKADDNSTTLKLYEGGKQKQCFAQGEDEVASLNWARRVFNNANGGLLPTDSGWSAEIKNGACLSVVGGAWHYNSAVAAFGGASNLGITVLPKYTLTSADVEDTDMPEGTVMQAGTFADCKVFMLNSKTPAKYKKSQELVKYLSTKAVQLKSFVEAGNVPAYAGCENDLETVKDKVAPSLYDLAKAQLAMNNYGIAQPFLNGTLNTYYYSKKAPEEYTLHITEGTNTRGARETLYKMEWIWQKGYAATEIPAVLPEDI